MAQFMPSTRIVRAAACRLRNATHVPHRFIPTSRRCLVGEYYYHHRHHLRAGSTSSASQHLRPAPPRTHDRGPPSTEETQTDFDKLDVLANVPAPTTAIDATFADGFALNSGLRVGGGAGLLLVAGDAFKWRPWLRGEGTVGNGGATRTGDTQHGTTAPSNRRCMMWECDRSAWGALELVWPKPDLLIVGTGATLVPLSPTTRKHVADLGIRLDVSDTRNAAAQFNLLATERGVQQVAAALLPIGRNEAMRRT